MKLGSIRDLEGNKPVLMDQNANGPDPVYWVFSEVSSDKWANITIIVSGNYTSTALSASKEYPKTFGHYHGVNTENTPPDETYHLISGEGVLQMQRKFFDGDRWIPEKVEKVYLIRVKPGEEVLITPEWGHSWSNVGKMPIISFDNWRSGHTPADYEAIKNLKGMSYYLVEENGDVKTVANPNYVDLPEPIWVTAEEFKKLQDSDSL